MQSSTSELNSTRIRSVYSMISRWRKTASTLARARFSVSAVRAARPCSCSRVLALGLDHCRICEISDSEWGDWVLMSPSTSAWVLFSLIAGVLIAMAVSHRSMINSATRYNGRRTVKDFTRTWPWPSPEVDESRDREDSAGEALPESVPDEEGEGPIGKPLYSGGAVCGLVSPGTDRV